MLGFRCRSSLNSDPHKKPSIGRRSVGLWHQSTRPQARKKPSATLGRYNDHCMQKASTLVTLCLHRLPHLPGTSPYLRVWSLPVRARIVPVPNKWERPTGYVNAILGVFMFCASIHFRLQCIRSQTFLAKTKSPNSAPSPPLKRSFSDPNSKTK